jgi:anti-sigma B factor antagonist
MAFDVFEEGSFLFLKATEKRLDASVASQFKNDMIEQMNKGQDCIVLDLSNVDFIDSSGLGAIVSSFKMLGNKKKFAIVGTKAPVENLFKLTRMNRVFPLFRDRDEAMKELGK